jgi:uncharacterized membrane protein
VTRSLRGHFADKAVGATRGFRWRGGREVSRLEGLSDAVFAFAITLLVVSLEVPHTFQDLMLTMRGFVAFAICFTLLFGIWYEQYVFFRRYGLENRTVVTLNAILIFVVLFYVYPLKFLFTVLVASTFGISSGPTGHAAAIPSAEQMRQLMLVFDAGYISVFLIFALLYLHAYRQRRALDLNAIERFDTRESIWSAVLQIGVAVVSLVLALAAGARGAPWSGTVYLSLGPLQAARGFYFGMRRRRLESSPAES